MLASQPDFKAQKRSIEEVIGEHNAKHGTGHLVLFLPKFHCELNPIERVWSALKFHLRANTPGNAQALRKYLPTALSTGIPEDSWGRYFRLSWRLMSAYRLGCSYALAVFAAKTYRSHRAIPGEVTMQRIEDELKRRDPKKYEEAVARPRSDAKAVPAQQQRPAVARAAEAADPELDVADAGEPAVLPDPWDDSDDDDEKDAGREEGEEKEIQSALQAPRDNIAAKPAKVGASLEDAEQDEANEIQKRAGGGRAMRKKQKVNYAAEKIGSAGIDMAAQVW